MSVLITGGAGFIGSHLAEYLVKKEIPVEIIDRMDGHSTANISAVMDSEFTTVTDADLLVLENLEQIIDKHNKVYHLAAKIGGVGYLRNRPADIIADNDLLNRRVFQACAHAGVDRLLFASSSMLYAEANQFPTNESLVGNIPPPPGSYGFQKLNGEYYCRSYYEQYDLEYVIPRIFNAVGPRDWPGDEVGKGHVVPDMVKKIVKLKQDPVKVKGSGKQTRCFTDVRDTVRGLYLCMEKSDAKNEAFNIGSKRETTIINLIKKIWKMSNREGKARIKTESKFERDVNKRVPDISKSESKLGWSPEYELEETLKWYIRKYNQSENI